MMREIIVLLLFSLQVNGKLEPVMIFEHIRHGSRAPTFDLVSIPWVEEFGKSELTTNGVRQQYSLGINTKKRFPAIFEKSFTASEYSARSTDFNRTYMSAAAHLIGLLTFEATKITLEANNPRILPPQALNFDVTKEFTFDSALPSDHVIFPIHNSINLNFQNDCPMMYKEINKELKELDSRIEDSVLEEIINKATSLYKSDYKIKDKNSLLTQCAHVADSLIMDTMNNNDAKVVEGDVLLTQLKRCYSIWTAGFTNKELPRKVLLQELIKPIIDSMDLKINTFHDPSKSYKMKYMLFSGHDTTLLPQLQLFNLLDIDCIVNELIGDKKIEGCYSAPSVASNIIYELLVDEKNSFFVKTSYNGKYFSVCKDTQKEEEFSCEYNTFKNTVMEAIFIKDQASKCSGVSIEKDEGQLKEPMKLDSKMWIIIGLSITATLLTLLIIVLIYMIKSSDKNRRHDDSLLSLNDN